VAHTANAQLHTVDPTTGASATIAGISLPFVDGLVLEAGRLWAVQNLSNQISRIRLARDLSSGLVGGGHYQRPIPSPDDRSPLWQSPSGGQRQD
jgi:hypothetical protein